MRYFIGMKKKDLSGQRWAARRRSAVDEEKDCSPLLLMHAMRWKNSATSGPSSGTRSVKYHCRAKDIIMNGIKPPRWIHALLDNLAPPHLAEEIKGDLNELFVKEIEETGARTARWRYGWRGIGFITKRFFWKRSPLPSQPSTIMLGNYFKMAKRSLLTHKATSFINIIGLVTGMAAALALIVIVRYELSFDTFHSKPGQIYRIVRVSGDEMSEFRPGVALPVHQALQDEISGLKDIVAVEYSGGAFVDVLDDS